MCWSRSRTSNGVATDVIVADRRRAAAFIIADVYPRVNDDADRRPIITALCIIIIMLLLLVIVPDDTTLARFD